MKMKNILRIPSYPDLSFAVISDIHAYNPSLGSSGAAFQKTMDSEQKLMLDSEDLLDFAIKEIVSLNGIRFVLIPGDLTKDGELVNHTIVANKLKTFTDAGIAVYVVPGNHDINNPGAVSYSGDITTPVATISAEDFAGIYGNFGFNSAIMRDNDSLGYVSELADGLWLLALDSCRYRENKPGKEEIVSGKISRKTEKWITSALKTAKEQNKAIIAMIHHGVVEHWNGQSKLHPDYLVNDYATFGKFLASWNVRLVFTGHYHAQDITLARFGDKFIYDIETGSLITPPCPIRYLKINNNVLSIHSQAIVDKIHPSTDFSANAQAFFKRNVRLKAAAFLKRFRVSDKDTDYIANAVGDAFYAHYTGDENPALRPPFDKANLGFWGRFIYSRLKYVIDGLWKDLPPADNDVQITL
jgi:3',5'-cyclic AMP phosphodiesterase CpdA